MPFRKLIKKFSKQRASLGPGSVSQQETHEDNEAVALPEEDPEEKGLHLLNPPASISGDEVPYSADIVFVHGLNGHWSRTWTSQKNGAFWPKDLLPHVVPRARVFSYGYPSQVIGSRSVTSVQDFAKHLLREVRLQQGDLDQVGCVGRFNAPRLPHTVSLSQPYSCATALEESWLNRFRLLQTLLSHHTLLICP